MEPPAMDFIESLGALTLDHRLKRIMHHLLENAEEMYKALQLPFRPRWASTYLLLLEAQPCIYVLDFQKTGPFLPPQQLHPDLYIDFCQD